MITAVGRSGNLASLVRVASTATANSSVPLVPPFDPKPADPVPKEHKIRLLQRTVLAGLPTKNLKVTGGFATNFAVRYAHTDLTVPNFDKYRKECTKDPTVKQDKTQASRMIYHYLVTGASCVAGVVGAKSAVNTTLGMMSARADVLAMSKIEIKLSDIPEGMSVTFKWRGKPLFVRHRTAEEIARENAVPLSELKDPQNDSERVTEPQWLIVIGVCTHLGCVPIANQGDYGGYYCPCHGSHYDGSGRIRRGPAPANLEVPEYTFPEPGMVIVG